MFITRKECSVLYWYKVFILVYKACALSHWIMTVICKIEGMKKIEQVCYSQGIAYFGHQRIILHNLINMDKRISSNLTQGFSLTFVQHFRASQSPSCPLPCLIFTIVFWCICDRIYNAVVRQAKWSCCMIWPQLIWARLECGFVFQVDNKNLIVIS